MAAASDIWWDYAAPAAGVVIVLLAVVIFIYGIGFNRKVAEPVFLDLQAPEPGKKQQKKKQKSKNDKKVSVHREVLSFICQLQKRASAWSEWFKGSFVPCACWVDCEVVDLVSA